MFLRVCSTVFSPCVACRGANLSVTMFVPRRIRAGSNLLVPKTTLGCSASSAAATMSVALVTITTTQRNSPTQIKLITFVLVDIIHFPCRAVWCPRFDVGLLNVDCLRDQVNLYLGVVAHEVWDLRVSPVYSEVSSVEHKMG